MLELPRDIGAYVDELLVKYLGEIPGREVVAALETSGLRAAIRSGYDVRLVADLLQRGVPPDRLPRDRLELYAGILDGLVLPDGGKFPVIQLAELAWTMVTQGEHRLTATQLGADVAASLADPGQRVLRVVGEGAYEFRHDQMRAYPAARHLADAPPSADALAAWLKDSPVWRRHKNEQAELFDFLATMLADPAEVQTLWRFAAADPGERRVLQTALQEVAVRRRWPLVLETAT